MILTDSKEYYEALLMFRSHGITRDKQKLTKNDGPWYYEQLDLGYNYRITDIQCALGISQLKRLDKFVEKRRSLAFRYDKAFADLENIVTPTQRKGCHNSYHLYVIQVKNKDRRQVFDALHKAGIGVNVHYIPVYTQPYYREHGYREVNCSNAWEYYTRAISLPLYPDLTYEEQDYVIEKVRDAVK